jgi:hypothetical protein
MSSFCSESDMSIIIAAVGGKELAIVYLAADHAEDDDLFTLLLIMRRMMTCLPCC